MMLLYSRYYLVLSLLSVIGLALPSDDGASVTTRKLAKGSKKNSSMLFQEEIPVYDTDVRPAWWWDSPEGYPYVQIKNDTPYDVSGSDGWDVGRFVLGGILCLLRRYFLSFVVVPRYKRVCARGHCVLRPSGRTSRPPVVAALAADPRVWAFREHGVVAALAADPKQNRTELISLMYLFVRY